MILPNFVIAGVPRCGTTSIYHYLKQHPNIQFPKLKEPRYFSALNQEFPHNGPGDHTVDDTIIKNFDDYKKLYESFDPSGFIGDASSDYMYNHRVVVPEMKRVLGDIPVVISIRNPIERAYSAFNNLVRDNREHLSFAEALKVEDKRIKENYDSMWHYKSVSLYADGIEHFMSEFTNVKVILFDDLENDAFKAVKEILSFIGLNNDEVWIDTSVKYSVSGKPKNKFVRFISDRNNNLVYNIRKKVFKYVPRKYMEKIALRLFKKDIAPEKVEKELLEFFWDDIDKTENLIKRDLSHWKELNYRD